MSFGASSPASSSSGLAGPADYLIRQEGTLFRAYSSDTHYPNFSGPILHTVLNNCMNARIAVGASMVLTMDATLTGTIDCPATQNVDWVFRGVGKYNTRITASGITGKMIQCVRDGDIVSVANVDGTHVTITTAAPHNLSSSSHILIAGTTSYNGSTAIYSITNSTQFVITKTWVSSQSGTFIADSWGEQSYTTVRLYDIGFNCNNDTNCTGVLYTPYVMMDIDHVFIMQNLPSGNGAIISGGGAGGPTKLVNINDIDFHYVTSARNNRLMDIWYDSLEIGHIGVAANTSSATQDLFDFDGERISILDMSVYIGSNCTLHNVINANGVYMWIGNVLLISSAPAATVASFIDASAGPVTIGNYKDGIPVTAIFHDATAQAVTTILNVQSVMKLSTLATGSLPATPLTGMLAYNSTTNKLTFWNGSAWEVVTSI